MAAPAHPTVPGTGRLDPVPVLKSDLKHHVFLTHGALALRAAGLQQGDCGPSLRPEFYIRSRLFADWGTQDELGRDNHQTVSRINTGLKKRGLQTWFDEDKMVRKEPHIREHGSAANQLRTEA